MSPDEIVTFSHSPRVGVPSPDDELSISATEPGECIRALYV